MSRAPKPIVPTLDLCNEAGNLLRQAGFILHHVSRQTEACYYRRPECCGVLRVAAHAPRRFPPGLPPVIARVTFNGNHLTGPAFIKIAPEKVHSMVAMAIGQYMLRCTAIRAMKEPPA